MNTFRFTAVFVCLVIVSAVSMARAQVGEPSSFTITIKQGASTLATKSVTCGPGGDLPDIKISDGTPESYTQIGTVGGSNPMILKVVTDDDPTFRVLHMYIDVPLSMMNIDLPGQTSLFDPSNAAAINVDVTNMVFTGGSNVLPQVQNNNSFMVAFMRDYGGHFYQLPQTLPFNAYGHGVNDIQVPGQAFLDGAASPYSFSGTPGVVSSWGWHNLVNPGPGTTIHNGFSGGLPSTGGGYVFELGLAVAFTAVPEPGTAAMVCIGLFFMCRRIRVSRG